jgi:hypothetical protein
VHGAYDVTLAVSAQCRRERLRQAQHRLKFFGDEGWIWVTREGYGRHSSDPQAKGADLPPLAASDRELLDPNGSRTVAGEQVASQELARERALAQAAAGAGARRPSQQQRLHRELDRMKLGARSSGIRRAERFKNDEEANSMLSRSERRRTARCIWRGAERAAYRSRTPALFGAESLRPAVQMQCIGGNAREFLHESCRSRVTTGAEATP